MTGMDELIAFVRAQLDDDERVARGAAVLPFGSAEWFTGAEGSVFGRDSASELHVRGAILSLDDVGVHIARWDPARVLAEIDAKRRILDDCVQADRHGDLGAVNLAESVVYALAQPYAGRDGWRQEWTA